VVSYGARCEPVVILLLIRSSKYTDVRIDITLDLDVIMSSRGMRHQLDYRVDRYRVFFNWAVIWYYASGINRRRMKTIAYTHQLNKIGLKPDGTKAED
jgi:hypothetical protein